MRRRAACKVLHDILAQEAKCKEFDNLRSLLGELMSASYTEGYEARNLELKDNLFNQCSSDITK